MGLYFLHEECKIIHGKVCPSNLLFSLSEKQIKHVKQQGTLPDSKNDKLLARNKARIKKLLSESFRDQGERRSTPSQDSNSPQRKTIIQKIIETKVQYKQDQKQLLTDLKNEYQMLVKEKNITNKKKKKNLKKKLKKKHEKIKQSIEELKEQQIQSKLTRPFKATRVYKAQPNQACPLEKDFICKLGGFTQAQIRNWNLPLKDIEWSKYMAPEQILGMHHDFKSDIWSLGCTIFELLTGDYLFNP